MRQTLILNALICFVIIFGLFYTKNPMCLFLLVLIKELPYDLEAHQMSLNAGVELEPAVAEETGRPIGFIH